MNRNLVGSIYMYGRTSIKIANLIPISYAMFVYYSFTTSLVESLVFGVLWFEKKKWYRIGIVSRSTLRFVVRKRKYCGAPVDGYNPTVTLCLLDVSFSSLLSFLSKNLCWFFLSGRFLIFPLIVLSAGNFQTSTFRILHVIFLFLILAYNRVFHFL